MAEPAIVGSVPDGSASEVSGSWGTGDRHYLAGLCSSSRISLQRPTHALTLNRPDIVTALFNGYADVSNDSPFAPVFPSTDTSVPQRVQNIAKAKALMSAAGHSAGFSAQLVTVQFLEMPEYAQIVVQAAKAIGVTIKLTVETPSAYYGKAVFGRSDWLDATMSLAAYGHRSVPNVYLSAPLQTTNAKLGTGSWNAAHFNDSEYDRRSQ